mgnify:CR=1 FL=1
MHLCNEVTRRQFVRTVAVGSAAISLLPATSWFDAQGGVFQTAKDPENLIPPGGGEELQRQLEGQMKKFEKQLREMERGGGPGLKLDFDLFKDLQRGNKAGGGAFNFNFKSSSSFKFVDENGSVEMKTTEGGKEVIVKDAEGEMLFEGPWDTEQDKAAAPEDIRERISVERISGGRVRSSKNPSRRCESASSRARRARAYAGEAG